MYENLEKRDFSNFTLKIRIFQQFYLFSEGGGQEKIFESKNLAFTEGEIFFSIKIEKYVTLI